MNDDKEYVNPGSYVFKPNNDDNEGKTRYSKFGKAFDINRLSDEDISLDLGSILSKQEGWKASNKELLAKLHEALTKLSDRQRQSIDLVFFQKKSFTEAGRIMGVAYQAVQIYCTRAIKLLQQYFQSSVCDLHKGRENQNDKT